MSTPRASAQFSSLHTVGSRRDVQSDALRRNLMDDFTFDCMCFISFLGFRSLPHANFCKLRNNCEFVTIKDTHTHTLNLHNFCPDGAHEKFSHTEACCIEAKLVQSNKNAKSRKEEFVCVSVLSVL